MKISGSPLVSLAPGVAKETVNTERAEPVARQNVGELPPGALQEAKSVLSALPEIDQARVLALRDALAKDQLPFDAIRLAGLIDRYHGGRS